MKNYIFLILLALTVHGLSAQKIIVDKVESDGSRSLMTKYTTIYSKMLSGGALSLCCNASSTDTIYMIYLMLNEGKQQIDVNRKLLIKMEDGSIITLSNISKIGPSDYEIRTGGVVTEYIVYPSYPVSKEDLLRMINNDVIKIRIETDIDYIDRNINGSGWSNSLQMGLSVIEKNLKINKTIYTDF